MGREVEASIQEKVTASISKEKRDLQSPKFPKPGSARVSRVGLGASPKQSWQYMSILRRRSRNTRTSFNPHAQRALHHFDRRPSGTAGIASPAPHQRDASWNSVCAPL